MKNLQSSCPDHADIKCTNIGTSFSFCSQHANYDEWTPDLHSDISKSYNEEELRFLCDHNSIQCLCKDLAGPFSTIVVKAQIDKCQNVKVSAKMLFPNKEIASKKDSLMVTKVTMSHQDQVLTITTPINESNVVESPMQKSALRIFYKRTKTGPCLPHGLIFEILYIVVILLLSCFLFKLAISVKVIQFHSYAQLSTHQ